MMVVAKVLVLGCVLLATDATAQSVGTDAAASSEEIARRLADPGAALISVPFQYNYLGSVGPGSDFHNQQLKIQPVISFVGENGKFILRPISPLSWNQFPENKHGSADLFVQGYYIPKTAAEARGTEIGFGTATQWEAIDPQNPADPSDFSPIPNNG